MISIVFNSWHLTVAQRSLSKKNPRKAIEKLNKIDEITKKKSWKYNYMMSMSLNDLGEEEISIDFFNTSAQLIFSSNNLNHDEKSYLYIYLANYIDVPIEDMRLNTEIRSANPKPNIENVRKGMKYNYPVYF